MKKITIGIDPLDKYFEGGIPLEKMTCLEGMGHRPRTRVCLIDEALKELMKDGFDITRLPIQKRMVIGGISFPVTDFRNGIIIVDYPEKF